MEQMKEKINIRRKTVAKFLNIIFWLVLITGIVVLPFLNIQANAPKIFQISRLLHIIFSVIMTVLVVMHIKLERKWENLINKKEKE